MYFHHSTGWASYIAALLRGVAIWEAGVAMDLQEPEALCLGSVRPGHHRPRHGVLVDQTKRAWLVAADGPSLPRI